MKQQTLQLTGGGDQSKRRELDFYPTPPECTHALMKFLRANVPAFQNDEIEILEPACGSGDMSRVIQSYGYAVVSQDIQPLCFGIGDKDFLNTDTDNFDAIITNPPFNLSVEFIKKALSIAPIVCMLLKSQYWHTKSRVDLFNENIPAYVLPLTWRPDFLAHTRQPGEKGNPTMEVAWTVWVRGRQQTIYKPLVKP